MRTSMTKGKPVKQFLTCSLTITFTHQTEINNLIARLYPDSFTVNQTLDNIEPEILEHCDGGDTAQSALLTKNLRELSH